MAMPRLTMAKAGFAPIALAVEHDVAPARMHQPGDAAQQRAFARAVGADHRHHLAGLDLQRDAEQRLEVAVVGVDAVDLEEGLSASASIPM